MVENVENAWSYLGSSKKDYGAETLDAIVMKAVHQCDLHRDPILSCVVAMSDVVHFSLRSFKELPPPTSPFARDGAAEVMMHVS